MENLKAIEIKPADLAALDDEALDALAVAIAAERKARAQNRINRLRDEIRRAASALGINEAAIIESLIRRAPAAPPQRRRRRKSDIVKYRDPENPSNTYSGRGTYPRWLREKLAAGANIEDFRVQESEEQGQLAME